MGIVAGSREVPGRNACDRRHTYRIIIIIIIIIIISFMQDICTYIPGTNYVPRDSLYSVVTIHGAYIVSFSVESIVFLY